MRKGLFVFGLVFVFAVAVSAVQAGPGCGAKAACGAKKAGCEAASQAVLAKLVKSLPSLTYRVGEFTTHCGVQAAQKAEETGSPVVYVVGEETFETEEAASAHAAERLEAEVARLASVRYVAGESCYACPVEAQKAATGEPLRYTVAGYTFETQEQADKAAEVVSAALAKLAEGKESERAGCPASCASRKADGGCASTCGKAQTASTEGKTGCAPDCAGRAKTASSEGKPVCPSSCATGKADGGCASTCSKAQTASAEGKPGCAPDCAGQAQTASAKGGCACSDACKDKPVKCCAPDRIATAMQKIETIVKAAATVAS